MTAAFPGRSAVCRPLREQIARGPGAYRGDVISLATTRSRPGLPHPRAARGDRRQAGRIASRKPATSPRCHDQALTSWSTSPAPGDTGRDGRQPLTSASIPAPPGTPSAKLGRTIIVASCSASATWGCDSRPGKRLPPRPAARPRVRMRGPARRRRWDRCSPGWFLTAPAASARTRPQTFTRPGADEEHSSGRGRAAGFPGIRSPHHAAIGRCAASANRRYRRPGIAWLAGEMADAGDENPPRRSAVHRQ